MNDPQRVTDADLAEMLGAKIHYTLVYDEMCEDPEFVALIPHLLWDRDAQDWSTFASAEEAARLRLGFQRLQEAREAAECQHEESRDA
jgi:hypothetical protein